MDSLFDDDQDEVGSEIEAYCPSPRCKADTNHTVISMYEDEIRRVQCQVCGDVHAYRKPRGDTVETQEEAAQRRKLTRKPSWDEAMGQVTEQDLASCRPYSIRDTYEEMDVVSHPKFGTGFVTELLPDNKVEITFKDERRVLVHNRSDLAQKMPELAEMPAPRDLKKRKRRKKGQSELASRLFGGEAPAVIDTNPETMAAKLAAAQRAAEEKRLLAIQMAATGAGLDESQLTPAQRRERKRLEREAEKAKKTAEREAEKAKKLAEREAEKAKKAAEKAKLKVQQEKERAKKKVQQEKERAKKKAQAERDRARKLAQAERDRERKKAQVEREREKKRLQIERARDAAKQKADALRKKKEAARVAAKKKAEQLKKAKAAKVAALAKKKAAMLAKKKKKAEQLKKVKAAKAAALAKKKAAMLAKKKKVAALAAKKKTAAAKKPKAGKKPAGKKPAKKPEKKRSGRR